MKFTATIPSVSPEEVEDRIKAYRRLGFENRSPAVIVYPATQHPCPWPDCGIIITAIDFQLSKMGDDSQREKWLGAWWQGSGLVARCPGCRRYVLYGYEDKHTVDNLARVADAVLPDDWEKTARIALRPT
ncbi:MAG: hypothetical protein L0Y71_24235 [Gemmataceae bacterium]|nr:hypothetical protein [Gemmataceae bacterium]